MAKRKSRRKSRKGKKKSKGRRKSRKGKKKSRRKSKKGKKKSRRKSRKGKKKSRKGKKKSKRKSRKPKKKSGKGRKRKSKKGKKKSRGKSKRKSRKGSEQLWFVYTSPPTEKQAEIWNLRVAVKKVARIDNNRAQDGWLIREEKVARQFMKKLLDKNAGKGLKLHIKKVKGIPDGWS